MNHLILYSIINLIIFFLIIKYSETILDKLGLLKEHDNAAITVQDKHIYLLIRLCIFIIAGKTLIDLIPKIVLEGHYWFTSQVSFRKEQQDLFKNSNNGIALTFLKFLLSLVLISNNERLSKFLMKMK